MQRIPLKLARPGMKLAKDVQTEDGKILCGAGTSIGQELIDRFSRMGIAAITVEGRPVKLPGEKNLSEKIKELDARFSRVRDDPVLKALMKLIAEHWIEEEKSQATAQEQR